MISAFMPQLAIASGVTDTSFYNKAFNATEEERHDNEDGSCHVIIYNIDGAVFMIHEVTQWTGTTLPVEGKVTVTVGLFVDDVQATVDQAVYAGATLVAPVQDFGYGYRLGSIIDPFGHRWELMKKI